MAYVVVTDGWGNDPRFVRGVKFNESDLPDDGYDLEWAERMGTVVSPKDAEDMGIRVRELDEMDGPIPVQLRVDHDHTPSAEDILAAGGDAEKALQIKREQFDEQAKGDLKEAAKANKESVQEPVEAKK